MPSGEPDSGAPTARERPGPAAEPRSGFRDRLAQAVERLAERGTTYGELSVDRLVAEAGISRSTFYKYFGDKGRLLRELSEAVQADFMMGAAAWLDLPAEASRRDYRAAFGTIFDTYRAHRVVMRSIVEAAVEDRGFRERFDEMMGVFVAAIAEHVRRGQVNRSVLSTRRADDLALWLTWMLEHGQLLYVGPAEPGALDDQVETATEILWRTLYSPRPAAP